MILAWLVYNLKASSLLLNIYLTYKYCKIVLIRQAKSTKMEETNTDSPTR